MNITKDNPKYVITAHPDGLCELVVNQPNNGDTGKYVCKAANRAGNSEISHYVLYEGKKAHIAENSHGVYHADVGPMTRAKSEGRGLIEGEKDIKDDESKNDSSSRGRGGGGSTVASVAPAPTKKLPRDARIVIHFATKLSNRVISEGAKVKLACYVEGAEPFVRWFKDDQPIVNNPPKIRAVNNNGLCTLELGSPTVADAGTYRCYARNDSGETETSATLQVYTKGDKADLAPTFTRSLKDAYHSNLNELSLSCHVRGAPTPTITWVKDGVTVEPSDKYQLIENDDGTCELIVSDVTNQDNGKYVCKAESRAGAAEIVHLVHVPAGSKRNSIPSPRKVSVAEKPATPANDSKRASQSSSSGNYERRHGPVAPVDPKTQLFFVAFLTDRTIGEGGKTKLSCYVQGPEPNVKWYKDENPVVFGPRCRAEMRDGLCSLTLNHLNKDDTGDYRVWIRNQYSEVSSTCHLTVYESIKEEGEGPCFTHSIKGAVCSTFLSVVISMSVCQFCIYFFRFAFALGILGYVNCIPIVMSVIIFYLCIHQISFITKIIPFRNI